MHPAVYTLGVRGAPTVYLPGCEGCTLLYTTLGMVGEVYTLVYTLGMVGEMYTLVYAPSTPLVGSLPCTLTACTPL